MKMRNKRMLPAEEREGKGIRRSLTDWLRLPQDVLCEDTIITVLGNTRVKIENYRSILIYSDTMIKLQTKTDPIEVTGKQLRIQYYDKDEMEISGHIEIVKFK